MSDQKRKAPVGSRNRKGIRSEMEVPVNLERVLIEAAKDLGFYQALIANPALALDERGYRLRASEHAMLSAMPQAALQKTIEQLRPEKLTKSRFAKQVATAVAGTLLFSSAACESESRTKGVEPDWPADASADSSHGINPDLPNDASAAGTGGSGGVDSSFSDNSATGGSVGIGSDWPMDASSDGSEVPSVGAGGSGGVDGSFSGNFGSGGGGVAPDWPVDASHDSSQESDANQPTWETDGATVSRGITPDFPGDAAKDSSDDENQGGN